MYVYVFFVFRCVYLCRVMCMPGPFSFLFLLVGAPAWVVQVVEMPRRGCLHLVFALLANGHTLPVNYTINDHEYTMRYYLVDGIYPNWLKFVQTILCP